MSLMVNSSRDIVPLNADLIPPILTVATFSKPEEDVGGLSKSDG